MQILKKFVSLHHQPHKENNKYLFYQKKGKNFMNVDLRTEGQKSRAMRNEAICKAYSTIRNEQPLVTRNKVLVALSKEYGLVSQTIKVILIKNGLYE